MALIVYFTLLIIFFDISTNNPGDIKLMMDVWLKLILEIRQDMCGHKSKLNKDDILLNLMQSRTEMQKYYGYNNVTSNLI